MLSPNSNPNVKLERPAGLITRWLAAVARLFPVVLLTRRRIALALTVAIIADGIQFILGPVGWAGLDQAVDVVAMLVTIRLLGFHMLLLPTFVVEFIPVADMLPTWTGCVAVVVALRKREQSFTPTAVPPQIPTGRAP